MKTASVFSILIIASVLYGPPLFSSGTGDNDAIPEKDRGNFGIFEDTETEDEVFSWYYNEHNGYGTRKHAASAQNTKYKNTVIMQRSGEKRLFDQNILLAALFEGRLLHNKYGQLSTIFRGSVFIDIGSGILYGNGAPTVRDIFEDDRIWTNLSYIIATDINGPNCRYIDSYRINRKDLPFTVRMISMKMIWRRHFFTLTSGLLKKGTSVIFRSANSGPDLYYPPHFLVDHFRSMIREYKDRDVLYLYNKFVLFKPRNECHFQKLGEIDAKVGLSHSARKWDSINWSKRKLDDLFLPNGRVITVR